MPVRLAVTAALALHPPAPGPKTGLRLCTFHAALDRTSNGPVLLRSAPGEKARVLARLPTFREEAGERLAPQFHVIASKDGWLLVNNVGFDGYDLPARRLFAGSGWIRGSEVQFEIEGPWLFEAPNPGSRKIIDMNAVSSPDRDKRLVMVHGCSGSMFDVTVELPDRRIVRGWGFGACSNQVTTCGGAGGIAIEQDGGIVLYQSDQ
jgi:hypothetical protein